MKRTKIYPILDLPMLRHTIDPVKRWKVVSSSGDLDRIDLHFAPALGGDCHMKLVVVDLVEFAVIAQF